MKPPLRVHRFRRAALQLALAAELQDFSGASLRSNSSQLNLGDVGWCGTQYRCYRTVEETQVTGISVLFSSVEPARYILEPQCVPRLSTLRGRGRVSTSWAGSIEVISAGFRSSGKVHQIVPVAAIAFCAICDICLASLLVAWVATSSGDFLSRSTRHLKWLAFVFCG